MGLKPRRVTRGVLVLAALLLAAAALDAALLWRDQRRNLLIAAGAAPADASVPELCFARAHALAASGAVDAALNGYRALQADPALGAAARFNSANLLLRQAIELRGGAQPGPGPGQGPAIALFELAKEQYRELLRQDPQHWDARYNLERAQRLLPDPQDSDLEPTAAQRERERAATTMRAHSLGLP